MSFTGRTFRVQSLVRGSWERAKVLNSKVGSEHPARAVARHSPQSFVSAY